MIALFNEPPKHCPTDSQRLMVENFQCPGCTNGFNTRGECFRFRTGGNGEFWCAGHSSGTFVSGVGRIALGLPKGFCRENRGEVNRDGCETKIRLFEAPALYDYNLFNVPVWGMEQTVEMEQRTGEDGGPVVSARFVFLRVFLPRVDSTFVHVIRDGKLSEITPAPIDVGPRMDDMD